MISYSCGGAADKRQDFSSLFDVRKTFPLDGMYVTVHIPVYSG